MIITSIKKGRKISYFKKKGIKFVFINSLKSKLDFVSLMTILKKHNYNRILCESGLAFLNSL